MIHTAKQRTRCHLKITRKTLFSIKYLLSLMFVMGLVVSLPSSLALAQNGDQPDTRPVDQQPGQVTSPNTSYQSAPVSTSSGWQSSLQNALANPDQLIRPVLGMVESTSNVVESVRHLANAQLNVTMNSADDVARLVYDGYTFYDSGFTGPNEQSGPISIVPVTVRSSSDPTAPGELMWLVTLSGTELVEDQATGVQEAILAGLNGDTAYKDAVMDALAGRIPPGERIILAGHSLGGLVAQQLAADPQFNRIYDIRNVVAYGSPSIRARREGTVRRLATDGDPVTYLGGQLSFGAHFEDAAEECDIAEYAMPGLGNSHLCGYINSAAWNSYDVFGIEGGDAIIDVHYDRRVFYEAVRD